MECGIQVVPSMIKTTGQVRTVITGFSCSESSDWQDFEVVAPYEVGSGSSSDIRAVMDFSACMTGCEGDACQKATDAGLPPCPS